MTGQQIHRATGAEGPRGGRRRLGVAAKAVFALLALIMAGAAQGQVPVYRLGAGDVLRIEVAGEKELRREVTVDATGRISFPLVGSVPAQGLTVGELKARLADRLRGTFLKEPQVFVSVRRYRDFFVDGDVKSPGAYAYEPGLTVRRAIALAGGQRLGTGAPRVRVLREGGEASGPAAVGLDEPLGPGDVLSVSEPEPCIECGEEQVVAGRRGLPLAGFMAFPAFSVDLRHNDNLFAEPDGERSSVITVFKPELLLENAAADWPWTLRYLATIGRYASSSADNFEDQLLMLRLHAPEQKRLSASASLSYTDGHDIRGSGITEGIADSVTEPSDWHTVAGELDLRIGAADAVGRLLLNAGLTGRDYDNNRDLTRLRDRDKAWTTVTLLYQVRPKTALLAELTATGIDYESADLDNDERRFLLGVRWDGLGKTSGSAKLGWLDKDFAAPGLTDFSDPSWELSALWQPRTYSEVEITSSRAAEEAKALGDTFIKVEEARIVWRHELNDRSGFQLRVERRSLDHNDAKGRRDRVYRFSAEVEYRWNPWLSFGARYDFTDRDSNIDTFDYRRNIVLFSARAAV